MTYIFIVPTKTYLTSYLWAIFLYNRCYWSQIKGKQPMHSRQVGWSVFVKSREYESEYRMAWTKRVSRLISQITHDLPLINRFWHTHKNLFHLHLFFLHSNLFFIYIYIEILWTQNRNKCLKNTLKYLKSNFFSFFFQFYYNSRNFFWNFSC